MFSTPSDPFAAVAFRVGVAALLLVLLMLALIVVLRFRLQRRQKREAAFNAVWRPLLVEAVSADVLLTSLPELPRSDEVFFFRLWNYLQASLRGSANERLNRVARHLRCDQYARADLQRGNRTDRLMAIIMLGQLRDMDAWDLLAHQAGLPDSLASLNAARALVQIDPLKAIGLLLPMLVYTNIGSSKPIALSGSICTRARAALSEANESGKPAWCASKSHASMSRN